MKNLKNKLASCLAAGIIGVSGLGGLSGCTTVEDIINDPLPRFLQSGSYRDRKESERGQWAGTAVANRIVNPDGSVIFIIDALRLSPGSRIDTNYTDKFLDSTKYNKSWVRNGTYGFIITYTPKNETVPSRANSYKGSEENQTQNVKKIYQPGDIRIFDGMTMIKTDKGYWIEKKEINSDFNNPELQKAYEKIVKEIEEGYQRIFE